MNQRIYILLICLLCTLCSLCSTTLLAATHRHLPLRFTVQGIADPEIQENVKKTLDNFRSNLHFPIKLVGVQHFVIRAPKRIQRAVAPYGYFKTHIQSHLTKTRDGWSVQFDVNLGPPLRITTMQIEIQGAGKNDPEFLKWKKQLPLHIGDRLQTKIYTDAKTMLDDIAIMRGYFNAKMVNTQIQINLTHYQVNIIMIYDTGPRFKFGETTFSKSPLSNAFLHKFLTYHAGEYYSAEKIENTQAGLLRGNYFAQVRIIPDIKNAQNNIAPINIKLILLRAKTYLIGIGYGTDTGIRGTAGMTLRYLNDEGHRFQVLVRASPQNSSAVAKYIIPGFNPANDLFTIGAGASYISQITGKANNGQFGGTYVTTHGHWRTSLSLAYLNERYNITTLPQTSTQLVYPALGFKYINTNNPLNPKKGMSFKINITGSNKNVLSEVSFFQATANLKTLYTIQETHTRFLFRADAGHTNIINLDNLPLSLQLFAGGAQSVRGYSYNGLGPGKNLAVASYEIQQRITGAFYLAGFVDAGTVTTGSIFQNIHVGSGPGIAWISPVGTIELTVGCAVSQLNRPWHIQFIMGTSL